MFVILDVTARTITSNEIIKQRPLLAELKDKFGASEVEAKYNLAYQLIKEAIISAENDYAEDKRIDYEKLVKDEHIYLLKIVNVEKSTLNGGPCFDIYLADFAQNKKIEAIATIYEDATGKVAKPSATIRSLQYFPNLENPNGVIEIVTISDAENKQFYYYTKGEFALDDFSKEHILISRLGNVDDPNEWVSNFTNSGKSLEIDEIRELIYNRFHLRFGFISVSASPNIEPMWGLYADKYKGAVLELEAKSGLVREVKYCNKRYKCDINDFNWRFHKICYQKSKKWDFEEEYRMILHLHPSHCTPVGSLMFVPLNVTNPMSGGLFTLKRILCGPCMPDELFNRLRYQQWRMAHEAKKQGLKFDVKIVKMKLRPDTYSLDEGETFSGDKYP